MEKARVNWKIILAAVVAVLLLVAGILVYRNWTQKEQDKEDWVKTYIEYSEPYTMGFDELPQEFNTWKSWRLQTGEIYLHTDNSNKVIGPNILGSLSECYVDLTKINIASPGNAQCQELFEKLEPYFQKAFVWEPDTTADECIERLKSLGSEAAEEEISSLCLQVSDLYQACDVERWFVLVTGGDLSMLPQETVASNPNLKTTGYGGQNG